MLKKFTVSDFNLKTDGLPAEHIHGKHRRHDV